MEKICIYHIEAEVSSLSLDVFFVTLLLYRCVDVASPTQEAAVDRRLLCLCELSVFLCGLWCRAVSGLTPVSWWKSLLPLSVVICWRRPASCLGQKNKAQSQT